MQPYFQTRVWFEFVVDGLDPVRETSLTVCFSSGKMWLFSNAAIATLNFVSSEAPGSSFGADLLNIILCVLING